MAGADRISELHDSILTRILSYLTTKEAVRTGILSKRWRNLWASVPVLDIHFAPCENGECPEKFVKFIDIVLTSRQVQLLDRFRLVHKKKSLFAYYNLPLKRWIYHVAQQCPRVLSIFLQRLFYCKEIPDLIFTCLSLEEIEFQVPNYEWHRTLNPTLVTLPHLRKLNLGHVRMKVDFMDKLLLGCPSLEELEL
ncbi:F-box/FBD-like domains containing protein [Rhynchospora pubera]|uniref:F-box/FBD-like domains containing protein n=1 Tax=Rhynchospora pubera TaxID=906938 RepID=A0AAV8EW82_9POAL|nr:F-box/FBD-like domains containing protein [Rhynchospora pubera]